MIRLPSLTAYLRHNPRCVIGLAGAAIGAEYFDLVVALFEGVKRMASSLHQKPTGHPVVVEFAAFEITIATRLGRR